jgi:hypothetical protein
MCSSLPYRSLQNAEGKEVGLKLGAVILGNGPSLRGFDFHSLTKFDVFGMNAAYRYWYQIGWYPQFYSCLDHVVGQSHKVEITKLIKNSDKLGIHGFLLRHSLIENLGEIAFSAKIYDFDLLRPGYESWIPGPVTTGSHTCAWASILGYRNIYLLGIDCNYVEVVSNADRLEGSILEIVKDAPNPNYFFDFYQQKGDKFNIPNPKKNLHLNSWRKVGDKIKKRCRVFNANLSSKVDAFPFIDIDEIKQGEPFENYSSSDMSHGLNSNIANHLACVSSCRKSLQRTELQTTLVNKSKKNTESFKKVRSVICYDEKWESTDITEQLSSLQAVKLLPETSNLSYFGFPWARLIDLLKTNNPKAKSMEAVLKSASPLLKQKKNIATVCQHNDLMKYIKLFSEVGITHVFWSHAADGLQCLPGFENITILPFPLANVEMLDLQPSEVGEKKYIYSFVEPKAISLTRSQSNDIILDHMAKDHRGLVIARDQWDFANIVYGKKGQLGVETRQVYANVPDSIDAWRILQDSIFSLCPTYQGVNSIRLWESIGCGGIPVIFNTTNFLPGNKALWDDATVLCSNRTEDILALPDYLESLARNESLLERKRHAMRQLWMLYGPGYFIYDIHKLFLKLAEENVETKTDRLFLSYGGLFAMASVINSRQNVEKDGFDLFILGCNSRVISDPSGFKKRVSNNTGFLTAFKKALSLCNRRYFDAMQRNLMIKGIDLNQVG